MHPPQQQLQHQPIPRRTSLRTLTATSRKQVVKIECGEDGEDGGDTTSMSSDDWEFHADTDSSSSNSTTTTTTTTTTTATTEDDQGAERAVGCYDSDTLWSQKQSIALAQAETEDYYAIATDTLSFGTAVQLLEERRRQASIRLAQQQERVRLGRREQLGLRKQSRSMRDAKERLQMYVRSLAQQFSTGAPLIQRLRAHATARAPQDPTALHWLHQLEQCLAAQPHSQEN